MQVSLLKALGLQEAVKPQGQEKSVVLGNGHTCIIEGSLNLCLRVDGQVHTVSFYALQTGGPSMILGFPFLSSLQLLVDCNRRQLYSRQENKLVRCCLHKAVVQPSDNKLCELVSSMSVLVGQLKNLTKDF